MTWLEGFRKDIAALEKVRESAVPLGSKSIDRFAKELEQVLSSQKKHKANATESKRLEEWLWKRFGASEVRGLRKEVRVQLRLMPMYRRLQKASNAELRQLARVRFEYRLRGPVFRKLLQTMHSPLRTDYNNSSE